MISSNRKLTFFTLVVLAGLAAVAIGAGPAWWATSGAVDGNLQENEYSAVNQGQLKHFTAKAVAELNAASPPDGAGPTLNGLVQSWTAAHPDEKDFEGVSVGQLKYIGALIYDRLGLAYPWSATTTDDNDEATANIGQLKQVFNFEIVPSTNGIPNWWIDLYFPNGGIPTDPQEFENWLGSDPAESGLTIAQKIEHGLDPHKQSTNDIGIPDGWLVQNGINPLTVDPDSDDDEGIGDGLSLLLEYKSGTDPDDRDTDGDNHYDGDEAFPADPTIVLDRVPDTQYAMIPLMKIPDGSWASISRPNNSGQFTIYTGDLSTLTKQLKFWDPQDGLLDITLPSGHQLHQYQYAADVNNNGRVLVNLSRVPAQQSNDGPLFVRGLHDSTDVGIWSKSNWVKFSPSVPNTPYAADVEAFHSQAWSSIKPHIVSQYEASIALIMQSHPPPRSEGIINWINRLEADKAICANATNFDAFEAYADPVDAGGEVFGLGIVDHNDEVVLRIHGGVWLHAYLQETDPIFVGGSGGIVRWTDNALEAMSLFGNSLVGVSLYVSSFFYEEATTGSYYGNPSYGIRQINHAGDIIAVETEVAENDVVHYNYSIVPNAGSPITLPSNLNSTGEPIVWDYVTHSTEDENVTHFAAGGIPDGEGYLARLRICHNTPEGIKMVETPDISYTIPSNRLEIPVGDHLWRNSIMVPVNPPEDWSVSAAGISDDTGILTAWMYKAMDDTGNNYESWVGTLVPIEIKYVDRDDPKKKWGEEKYLGNGKPLYAGEKNGDMVSFKLAGTDSWTSMNWTWTAEGPGGETITGPTGAGKNEWKIADGDADTNHDWIDWKPGKWKIKVQIGSITTEFEQVVGARTTDVVVVGWINPAGVPLNASGMPEDMTRYYPPSGVISSATQKLLTVAHLGLISGGATIRPGPAVAMNAAEKEYIVNWMFKFAANSAPPNSFADEEALENFKNEKTNYKLYNRFQIKYLLSEDGTEFKEKPKILKEGTAVGTTLDPIFHLHRPGTLGRDEGKKQIKEDKVYHQTNDGSPEDPAVSAFNTLLSPVKWNHIGSTISLGIEFELRYEILEQVYPTYYIYERIEDGSFYLYQVIPQAANPKDNFNSNPYDPPLLGPAPFILPP